MPVQGPESRLTYDASGVPARGGAAVHIAYDDLHYYSQGKLGRFRAFVIENHLRACALCTARMGEVIKLLAAPRPHPTTNLPPLPPQDRRRETRIPANDPAQLQVVAPFSPEATPARIVDVSRSGMQVSVAASLAPGSTVKIRLRDAVVFAEVRYCRAGSGGEYRAGLMLQEVISRSEIVRVAFAHE